jgi:hypothetical protein
MNVAAAIRIGVRCRGCSQFRHRAEFVGGPVVGFCFQCFERHQKAMDMLAANVPPGCQECGRTLDELQAANPQGDVPMRLHDKDGIKQVLCVACSDEYERKRLDLYGGTPYGRKLIRA